MKTWKYLAALLVVAGLAQAQWCILARIDEWALTEVAFTDSLEGWAIDRYNAYRTIDRGSNWIANFSIPVEHMWQMADLSVPDKDHIYVSYDYYLYNTRFYNWQVWVKGRAYGGVWRTLFYVGRNNSDYYASAGRLQFADPQNGWHIGCGDPHLPPVAVRTSDGGSTWLDMRLNWSQDDPWFVTPTIGWRAGSRVSKTTNAGDTWQVQTSNIGARRIQMLDTLEGWVVTDGGLNHTTSGGNDSWPPAWAQPRLRALSFCSPIHGVAVGDSGLIIRTTDGGETWLRDTVPRTWSLKGVYMLDSAHIWAVGDSGLVLGYGPWASGLAAEPRPLESSEPAWPTVVRASELVRYEGRILDALGREVRSATLDLGVLPYGQAAHRTSPLPPGVYFLKSEVRNPNAELQTRKVVVTR